MMTVIAEHPSQQGGRLINGVRTDDDVRPHFLE
jgi:hypothetical protein